MKIEIRLCALLVCALAAESLSMDGVCIVSLQKNSSYLSEITFGRLVKYEIVADSVVAVDTLIDTNAGSPKINMSGTYYAYVKSKGGNDYFSRTLVIKPLYGNPTSQVEIPLQRGANWIWWVENNTFFYSQNPVVNNAFTGHNVIRKLTLKRVNDQLVAEDHMWVKTPKGMQGGFVGLDLTGTKLSYKTEPTSDSFIVTGDSTKPPTQVSVGIVGCGNSVSPSGTWWTQFPGGHSAISWGKWDASFSTAIFFSTLDSIGAIVQSMDPMRNLEVHPIIWGMPWSLCRLGSFGAENIYSQNSDDWFVTEVAAVGDPVSCVNAVAINRATKKAINITKIVPVKQTYTGTYSGKTSFEFRYKNGAGSFPGGTQWNADRPALWCSSQPDVLPSLWDYVRDRQADNQAWATLLGLPLSQIPGSDIREEHTVKNRANAIAVKHSRAIQTVIFPVVGEFSVVVTDLRGRTVNSSYGRGQTYNLPRLQPGNYLLTAKQSNHCLRSKLSIH